jgi:hypothetical protein
VKEREGVSVSLADQRGESLPGSWVAGLEERESGRVLGVRARVAGRKRLEACERPRALACRNGAN